MAKKSTYFKYCIVPLCISTTVKTPNKIFLRIPDEESRRIKWIKACKRNVKAISQTSGALHVCEDHFNLEEDMVNYVRFKLMGGRKAIKADVVPHIFIDQLNAKREFPQPPVSTKRIKCILDDAVAFNSISSKGDLDGIERDSNGIQPVQASRDMNDAADPLAIKVEKKDVSTQIRPEVRSQNIQCELHCDVTVGLSPSKIYSAQK